MIRLRSQRGQASVELVALLPLLAGVALAVLQLLAAGAAAELAEHAAGAGAIAMLEGGDPRDAARRAAPAWSRGAMSVTVRGRMVRVRVRPPAPLRGLGDLLAHTAEARAAR
ncbi:MAG: hypothetical protein U0T02_02870 [Solirubrobacteraceae bacterium]